MPINLHITTFQTQYKILNIFTKRAFPFIFCYFVITKGKKTPLSKYIINIYQIQHI